MARRARLPIDERREQLLGIGLKLFGKQPYDDVSIDEVADRAGISKGLLYHYFPSKKIFYVEVVRAAAKQMVELTASATSPDGSSIDALRASILGYLDYIESNANGYRTILRSGVGVDPKVFAIIEGIRTTLIARATKSMGLAAPSPLLRVALRGWFGFVETACLDWLDHRDVDRGALAELFVETFVHAMAIPVRKHAAQK